MDKIKPDYYKSDKYDVIDVCNHFKLNFNIGNVLKYVVRAGKKEPENHLQDLRKAKEYLEREIKFMKMKNQLVNCATCKNKDFKDDKHDVKLICKLSNKTIHFRKPLHPHDEKPGWRANCMKYEQDTNTQN